MLNKSLFVLSVLAGLLVIFCGPVLALTITISTGNYAPWTGKNLEDGGPYLRVVREVFNRAGYVVEFKFYPWKRALIMSKEGKVDASAYWATSEQRKEDFYQSEPLAWDRVVFFHRKEKPLKDWEDFKDLREYRIGVTRGYTYTDEFWKQAGQGVLNFDKANNDLSNFRKLIRGRIDLFPCEKIRGYTLLDKHFTEEAAARVSHCQKPLAITSCHLIFPKAVEGSSELLKKFNEQLKALKEEGDYDSYWENINSAKGSILKAF
ncbi:MAG: transporter substrate-binding domain-containing protein [Desulfobacteraceae bacterium]|nr:transporter substrate-binding domain-containing protein [Desulfobacteraceae bacterium]